MVLAFFGDYDWRHAPDNQVLAELTAITGHLWHKAGRVDSASEKGKTGVSKGAHRQLRSQVIGEFGTPHLTADMAVQTERDNDTFTQQQRHPHVGCHTANQCRHVCWLGDLR
jgi:hypothetical protein